MGRACRHHTAPYSVFMATDRQQHLRAKGLGDLVQRWLPGLNHVARQLIGVNYVGAEVVEDAGDKGLA